MQNTSKAEQKAQKVVDTRPTLTARWRALEGKGWRFDVVYVGDGEVNLEGWFNNSRYAVTYRLSIPWSVEIEANNLVAYEQYSLRKLY